MVLHADLENHAIAQAEVFVGTAGSVVERRNASSFAFYAHQFYDADGKKRERYLAGPVGSPDADKAAGELRSRIRDVKELVPSLRMLAREGFCVVDRRTYATVASLHNHGVFRAGGALIGSHAYGVLLNRLGARTAPYATEDIDIARRESLAFDPVPDKGFLDMLRGSGLDFVEVPQLDRKQPATSFKQRGRSVFQVDLLVPSPDDAFQVVAVPELRAHATGLPYLRFLLGESQMSVLLAREGCCAVRVPVPERFAVHKLVVSQLRRGRTAKSANDVAQACAVAAALADGHPGALEAARKSLPASARRYLVAALAVARPILQDCPAAVEELAGSR
jgi:hypothetical protein